MHVIKNNINIHGKTNRRINLSSNVAISKHENKNQKLRQEKSVLK